MKFSDFKATDWLSLQPYLDTCLLPVTGLFGHESPPQMTSELEKLRDAMAPIEETFHGRLVTLPAIQYRPVNETEWCNSIQQVAQAAKHQQFKFVVVVTTVESLRERPIDHVDLLLVNPERHQLTQIFTELWQISR